MLTNSNIVKHYYNIKYLFSVLMYFTMSFIPVMQSRTFSSQYFSVIYDSSEIIAICRFGAQETFLIINVEKWSSN